MQSYSTRLATWLLRQHLQVGEFEVSLTNADEAREVKEALELLGCQVTVQSSDRRLTVECPHDGAHEAEHATSLTRQH
jgi:hypothetical protein